MLKVSCLRVMTYHVQSVKSNFEGNTCRKAIVHSGSNNAFPSFQPLA